MGDDGNKKRKRAVVVHQGAPKAELDTSKPTAEFQSSGSGRSHTLSLAIPGSIIANAQTKDLQASLAGRIARAAAVFCVDEIIVFNDGQNHNPKQQFSRGFQHEDGYTGDSDPDNFLFHVLSYLECPANLRRRLFPQHPNLMKAGTLPSLDMPHHPARDYWTLYREGVTMDLEGVRQLSGEIQTPSKKQKKEKRTSNGAPEPETTAVDVGFWVPVTIPVAIPPNTRVTVKFPSTRPPLNFPYAKGGYLDEPLMAEVIDPVEPREQGGYYWGYTVRQAASLSAVFTECVFENGYDVSIGTSERGIPLSHLVPGNAKSHPSKQLPRTFDHALVVLGGVAGLEAAAAADKDLVEKGIGKENVSELFDFWVNACPGQGSRTIRTEEATWVVLSQLHEWAQAVHE